MTANNIQLINQAQVHVKELTGILNTLNLPQAPQPKPIVLTQKQKAQLTWLLEMGVDMIGDEPQMAPTGQHWSPEEFKYLAVVLGLPIIQSNL